MNQDYVDLSRAFVEADVGFLVVGAYALALHAKPRATGDLDLWVEPSVANAQRVFQALQRFGAPLQEVRESQCFHAFCHFLIAAISTLHSMMKGCIKYCKFHIEKDWHSTDTHRSSSSGEFSSGRKILRMASMDYAV